MQPQFRNIYFRIFCNTCTVQGVSASGVSASRAVYETQRYASTIHCAYGKGFCTLYSDALLCMTYTLQSELEGSRRVGLFRFALLQLLTGSAIKEFSSNSAAWALEVLFCLFCYSFSLIGNNMLWWVVVGGNCSCDVRSASCQCFGLSCSYSSCTPQSSSRYWRIRFTIMLTTTLWLLSCFPLMIN